MFQKFQSSKFKRESLELVERCNSVISDYLAQGYTLTLRQLYYQMVARAVIENTPRSYKNLGELVSKARLAGLIDWNAIEDRTRNVDHPPAWSEPEEILQGAANAYKEDLWLEQKYHVEVWIEKEALVGVVEPICQELRLPLFACRGYASISELYHSGARLGRINRIESRTPVILHLGDHDPSGIDMTRDNDDRLAMFAGRRLLIRRLALNMDQIEEYDPPPNPAKVTDSRFQGYAAVHGDESWELDALEPQVIVKLIREATEKYIDRPAWDASLSRERERRDTLQELVDRYEEVADFLKGEPDEEDT